MIFSVKTSVQHTPEGIETLSIREYFPEILHSGDKFRIKARAQEYSEGRTLEGNPLENKAFPQRSF
jgi:hypothetical protein